MKFSYPAVFYPWDEDEGEGYTVTVPDLPGCMSEGDSLAEAILMGIDAASGWIRTSLEDGEDIPPPSRIEDIKPDEDIGSGFVNWIALDIEAYAEKYGYPLPVHA
ncbi:MAG: type II toxin-antitoxin system HicB family antitoxin [Holophagales bacterium]|jgi:predicted RNase H-like HicB family nuclease|nr:type II toxin-antitoxin system HicB family antitoxin [Holophagales bacterium]